MKEAKIKCTLRINKLTADTIKNKAIQMNCSQGEYIEKAVKAYEKKNDNSSVEETVKRIQKSVSYIDIAIQIAVEMLNMMAYDLNCTTAIKDDKFKTETYLAAKDLVKERIRKAKLGKSKNIY